MSSDSLTIPTTRAVQREVRPGNSAACAHCGKTIKFQAKVTRSLRQKIICNVYEDGKWDRIEHYHLSCYETEGKPYGEIL